MGVELVSSNETAPKTLTDKFDLFWRLYPRKRGKGAARRAFEKALKRADFATIIGGLQAYLPHLPDDHQFIPHPSTWLNGERWDDEYEDEINGREQQLADDRRAILRGLGLAP